MAGSADFSAGGFRFIPAVFQYSGGVAAVPGYAIVRVRFREPLPLREGFAHVERRIKEAGRPLTSFCACELRSPAPFTEQGFRAFNEVYVVTLQKWGLFDGKVNPVARSNVCPEGDPPAEPSFHAFSFTVASDRRHAELRDFRQRGSARGQAQATVSAPSATAKPAPTPCARRAATFSARWSGGWRRSTCPGPTPPRRRSIPSMTCIRSWPTRSCGVARRVRD